MILQPQIYKMRGLVLKNLKNNLLTPVKTGGMIEIYLKNQINIQSISEEHNQSFPALYLSFGNKTNEGIE